jgi:hypothetical protein
VTTATPPTAIAARATVSSTAPCRCARSW